MKFYLIRHGKAQERDLHDESYDALRELTYKGEEETAELSENLSQYLLGRKVLITDSGILRSVQTADILSEIIPNTERDTSEILTSDNTNEVINYIKEKAKDYEAVILVGHNPYLEMWISDLTGISLEFEKSAIAELEFDVENERNYLNWYLKSSESTRLRNREEYTESMEEYRKGVFEKLDLHFGDILKFRERYIKLSEEVESVHKLRVRIRSFRSLISFFKPLMKKADYRDIQSDLRAKAQELAYLRELDVLKKEWIGLMKDGSFIKKNVCGEKFLEVLTNEREHERVRLLEILEKPKYREELDSILEKIKKSIDVERSPYYSLDEMVKKTVNSWFEIIEEEYKKINENDLEIVHALRIKAKKIRYIMEIFNLDEDEELKNHYESIREWQEVIGNICDANRNEDAVLEISQHYEDNVVNEEIKVFNEIQKIKAEELYIKFFDDKDIGATK